MSSNVINFVINVNGNSIPVMMELNDTITKVKQNVDAATSNLKKMGDAAFSFESIKNVVVRMTRKFAGKKAECHHTRQSRSEPGGTVNEGICGGLLPGHLAGRFPTAKPS